MANELNLLSEEAFNERMSEQNRILAQLLKIIGENTLVASMKQISSIVSKGLAEQVFSIGDQINTKWKKGETTYDVPLDIVHFENVDLRDAENVPGMFTQWHYCVPDGVTFDAAEAFYVAEKAILPAGTYNVVMGETWGKNCQSGKTYQFTLTKPVPVNGQLAGFDAAPDKSPAEWKVRSYENSESTTPIETVSVAEGNAGTNLGTFKHVGDGKINSLQRTAYGYNRWSQSVLRQYLNSDKPAGSWWKPKNKYDRPPVEHSTMPGFLYGLDAEFVSVLKEVRVRTALNTLTDSADGAYEDTYDKVFLPSLQQLNIDPEVRDVEGSVWEYWKRASGHSSYTPKWKDYVDGGHPITYNIAAKTSVQSVRLRSAGRGYAYFTWTVSATGYVNYSYATGQLRFTPACVI